jgi:hypothetical protein
MTMFDLLVSRDYIGDGNDKVADKTKGEKEVVWSSGRAVYVEFAGVTGGKDRMQEMQAVVRARGIEFVGLRAEDVFDPLLKARLGGKTGSHRANLSVDLGDRCELQDPHGGWNGDSCFSFTALCVGQQPRG